MVQSTPPESILSHGEQDVAGHLRAAPDASPATIADARNVPEDQVRKAVARIREKTRRAFATLDQSPFTAECARELDPAVRRELAEALRTAEE